MNVSRNRLFAALLLFLLILTVAPFSEAAANPIFFDCSIDPQIETLLARTSQEDWAGWILKLSGEVPVMLNSEETSIQTRYSYAMFNDYYQNAEGYEFVRQTLLEWYPPGWLEEDSFKYGDLTWKNLILTIPGATHQNESVILSAHLDSTSNNPYYDAPGAEDNASGSAALLEAARILQGEQFPRTIKLIWFTGEEQGLIGSRAYVNDHDLSGVQGVINLDMYGYDSDADGCFELHVGQLPQSNQVGQCMVQAIQRYGLPLNYDYLTSTAVSLSDHASFWGKGIAAVEILENHFDDGIPGGCLGVDRNPNYHRTTDTIDKMNLPVGFSITKAALAAAFSMAGEPPIVYQAYFPLVGR